jgi:catechol 2,3-dioxygenase-like lactoylglutathione lyase family enzyme
MAPVSRRRFVASLPVAVAASRLLAQSTSQPLSLRNFNHVTLTVANLQRSIDFYQGLFGFPLQSRQATETAALTIGGGPRHLGLSTNPSSGVRTPRIDHMCFGLDGFDLDRLLKHLAEHGIPRSEQPGAMRVHVRMRSAALGGGATGTPEVYLGDPDGVLMQTAGRRLLRGCGSARRRLRRPGPFA